MNSAKSPLAKLGKFVGKGASHVLAATVTGVASVGAFLFLIIPDSLWVKVVGFVLSLVIGYLVTFGLAYLRGER